MGLRQVPLGRVPSRRARSLGKLARHQRQVGVHDFFDPVIEINALKDEVMSALGYDPADPVQRFFIPSSDRQAAVLAQYATSTPFSRA